MNTVQGIPSSPHEWRTVLNSVRQYELDDASHGDSTPVPHDALVEFLTGDVTEQAADFQLDLAADAGVLKRADTDDGDVYVLADRDNTDETDDTGEVSAKYVDPGADHPANADRVTAALNAATDYFHAKLTEGDLYLLESKWGITEDTAEKKQIGFAPEDDRLVEYLRCEGFTAAEIVATGLVTCHPLTHALGNCNFDECWWGVPADLEVLAATINDGDVSRTDVDIGAVLDRIADAENGVPMRFRWNDRLTIPYFDENGNVTYIIARATRDEHAENGRKYKKLKKNALWTHDVVGAPFYGADAVTEQTEEVIVTEGITDAIAVQQAGIPSPTPATTEFKRSAVADVADLLSDVDDVYVIMDNEENNSGLNGALKTATTLRDHGVDALVGTLPRPDGVEKVDIADFLKQSDAPELDLYDVLAGAKSPRAYDYFDEDTHTSSSKTESGVGTDKPETAVGGDSDAESTGNKSALFGLEISDVASTNVPSRPGDRGPNPFLGELNSSGNHFAVTDDEMAWDHHAAVKAAYTPFTWLLCDAGVRDPHNPEGSLTDEEIWEAWRHAKKRKVIPDDDPLPWRARLHIVRDHELLPPATIPDEYDPESIPKTVYNKVIDIVRYEYGFNPGLRKLGGDGR